MWRNRNPCILLVGTQTSISPVEDNMQTPQHIRNGYAVFSSSSFPKHLPEEYRITNLKGSVHSSVHCGSIYNIKSCKQPKFPSLQQRSKNMAYMHCRVLFNHKIGKLFPFTATQMTLEEIILSKISQKEKDRYCIVLLL